MANSILLSCHDSTPWSQCQLFSCSHVPHKACQQVLFSPFSKYIQNPISHHLHCFHPVLSHHHLLLSCKSHLAGLPTLLLCSTIVCSQPSCQSDSIRWWVQEQLWQFQISQWPPFFYWEYKLKILQWLAGITVIWPLWPLTSHLCLLYTLFSPSSFHWLPSGPQAPPAHFSSKALTLEALSCRNGLPPSNYSVFSVRILWLS